MLILDLITTNEFVKIQREKIQTSKKMYLNYELLENLKNNTNVQPNVLKENIYSLGLIVLSYGLNKEISDIQQPIQDPSDGIKSLFIFN